MKPLHIACAWLVVLLGLAHCGFTFARRELYTLDSFWFALAGFALIFAGFLNLAAARNARDALTPALAIVANLATLAMLALMIPLVPGAPQVYTGIILFALLTGTTWRFHRQARATPV